MVSIKFDRFDSKHPPSNFFPFGQRLALPPYQTYQTYQTYQIK